MNKAIIYIHGKGGNAKEAEHYKPLFENAEVIGFDYTVQFLWEAKAEFPVYFDSVSKNYESVILIANSIGAFFAMSALSDKSIEKAYCQTADCGRRQPQIIFCENAYPTALFLW